MLPRFSPLLNPAVSSLRRATMCTSAAGDTVVFTKKSDKTVLVTLNKPQALNALDLPMVRKMTIDLHHVVLGPGNVKVVMFEGAGEKAFCAGGDVRSLYDSGISGDKPTDVQVAFFTEEYALDHAIQQLQTNGIQQVAFYDGFVLGGGVGISIHAPFKVATENAMFAMPETAIGLFPDVGGSYFLPRLPSSVGMYLALTGARLKGRDTVVAGVATHYVPRANLAPLKQALTDVSSGAKEEINAVVTSFAEPVDAAASELYKQFPVIDRCFSASSVEGIVAALRAEGSPWAEGVVNTLAKMSPTSMKITFEQIRRSKRLNLDLRACLDMELHMALRCMEGKDFYEGVRCMLVDKGSKPTWSPKTLEEVTPDIVESYFSPRFK